MQCQAKAKSTQKQCTRRAMKGKRVCYVHGGATPGGMASPHFKTGRYSKYLPERLFERYQEAVHDDEILALREEIALIDARLAELLMRIDTGESGSLWRQAKNAFHEFKIANSIGDQKKMQEELFILNNCLDAGINDYQVWNEISQKLEQRRRLVETERKRLVDMEQMVTAERAMLLLSAVANIIRTHVTDRKVLAAISMDITNLISVGESKKAEL